MVISVDTGEEWTYREVDEYSNRVANYFRGELGFVAGDVVAVNMTNKPKMVPIVLGLAKIGVVFALINTNLRDEVTRAGFLEHFPLLIV